MSELSPRDLENLNSGKKRSLNVSEWKDKKQKRLRNCGLEYTNNRGQGKLIPAKELPVTAKGCGESCAKEGCRILSLNTVHELHKTFYKLNYNEQQLFLLKYIHIREMKRRRKGKTDATSLKLAGYDFNINNKPVCRKTLLNVFSITIKRVRVLQNKLKDGEVAPRDKRGIHLNRRHATNKNTRDLIREHVKSFPLIENHYSRNVSAKKCLSIDLSVRKMHRLYIEKYPQNSATYSMYRKIFNRDFNLRFGSPRSDTCKLCDQLYAKLVLAATDNERKEIESQSLQHHMKADAAYKQLAEDGSNPNYITLCVDLQQVLFTPTLRHSDIYYQRQYSNYNFAVHNMSYNQPHMFLWHQTIAKRGSKEIGSCILNYITTTFKKLGPTEERKLVIWCDRCVGQNNNKTILCLYMYLIRSGYFTEVHQKFMITGHSFLPCDRDFALIERQRKKMTAIVPGDLKYIIAASKLKSPYFLVTDMNQEDFKDLDVITNELFLPCRKFQITKFVWFKMCKDDVSSLYARESHNSLRPWKIFNLFKSRLEPTTVEFTLPQLYTSPIPVQKEKKKDLLTMVEFFVNPEHKQFYNNLPSE